MIEKPSRDSSPEAIDEYVFPQIDRVKIPVSRDILPDADNITEQKNKFLAGDVDEINFTYEKNKDIWYDEKEIILLDLKHELSVRRDFPEIIRKEYLYAINERLAKIRILREIQLAEKDGRQEYHARRFDAYSRFIYGVPHPEIFANVIATLQKKLQTKDGTPDLVVQQAYDRLQTIIESHQKLDVPNSIPPFQADAPSEDTEDVLVNAEELKRIFDEAIQETSLSDGWKVIIDSTGKRNHISVNGGVKKIRIPNSEQLALRIGSKKLTKQKILGLIEHEIKTHALRHHNGSRSELKLLGTGLRNYIEGEEGLATYREQQETKVDDYAGFSLYFAAGLAKGLDGGGERAFAAVHKILKDYFLVNETGVTESAAAQSAWNVCLRIFNGTPGNIPGVIFSKDTVYRKGNIATWQLMNAHSSDDFELTLSILDFGKFDQTNERQRQVVASVRQGITNEALVALEEE